MTFRLNVRGILSTIGIYGDLIEKLDDKSCIKHTMNDDQVIKIKQYVMLNVISWLMSLIESLFVLTHSLSSSYSEVNENMTRYRNSLFWDICRNIQSRKYDLTKVLAFRDVTTLDLTIDEQVLLKRIYDEITKNIYHTLDELAIFYDKYNVIYNKSKHGLIFFPGGFSQQEEKRFNTSSLSAYDRRPEGEMPSGYFKATQQEEYQKWLNVEAHLNFKQALFQQVGTLVNYLETLSTYIVDCNLNFANAKLVGAHLSGSDLSGAVCSDTDLSYSYLIGSNLSKTDFTNALMRNAHLTGANLSGAILKKARFVNVDADFVIINEDPVVDGIILVDERDLGDKDKIKAALRRLDKKITSHNNRKEPQIQNEKKVISHHQRLNFLL